jgi:hypothetical protein
MEIPVSLFRNRSLSIGARMLMCYLTSLQKEDDGTRVIYVPGMAKQLGLTCEDMQAWLEELDDHAYIVIADTDSFGKPCSIRFGWDIPGQMEADGAGQAEADPNEVTPGIEECPLLKILAEVLFGRTTTETRLTEKE